MPSLPNSKKRPWMPKPAPREYQAHAVRTTLYDTTAWRKLRLAHLKAEPLCRVCRQEGRVTPATVLDHIKPVNEGADFWDSGNHQPLCLHHHQRKSQSERYSKKKP